MKAKRGIIIVIIVTAVVLLLSFLSLRPAYTGPGVEGNLIWLEVAKARWQDDHKAGTEWPTKKNLLPYLTKGKPWTSFNQVIHPVHGEIYIINKTGAPVYAYDPRTEMLSSVSSNRSNAVKFYLKQIK